jgi:tetratricopeptide (TPR) repeat protein
MHPERSAPFRQLLDLVPEIDALEVLRIILARRAVDRPELLWSDGLQAATVDVRVLGEDAVRKAVREALVEQQRDTQEIYEAIGDALIAEIGGDRTGAALRLVQAGEEREERGRYAAALRFYRTAADAAGPLGDRSAQILAFRRIGRVQLFRGEAAEAEAYYRRSLELAQDVGALRDEVIARTGLGNVLLRLGRWQVAGEVYREALARLEGNGEEYLVERASLLNNLAWVAAKQDDFETAEGHVAEAGDLWRSAGSPIDRAIWHSIRAHIRWEQGAVEEARAEYEEVLSEDLPPVRRAGFEIDLANLALDIGDLDEARQWGRKAESSALAASAVGYISEVYRGLANIARESGDEAVPLYEKSLEIARRYALPLAEAETLVEYAKLQRTSGNPEEARAFLEHATTLLDQLGAVEEARRAREELGRASDLGDPEPLPAA